MPINKVIIAFCEGQHDISFISRILLANGYSPYNNKIKDFLAPFNKQFEDNIKSKKIGDRKLGFHSNPLIPSVVLIKDSKLIFLHSLDGDGQVSNRNKILDMYKNLKGNDDFTSEFLFSYRFLYFFDADSVGIEARMRELNCELDLSSVIPHAEAICSDDYEWGAYIFHKDSAGGDLEDILLDLIKVDQAELLNNSHQYITDNALSPERQREYICTLEKQEYKIRNQFKYKKSALSIAGQLQFSGMSNSVFIAKTDYLNFNLLTSNSHCTSIANLFNVVL